MAANLHWQGGTLRYSGFGSCVFTNLEVMFAKAQQGDIHHYDENVSRDLAQIPSRRLRIPSRRNAS